MKKWIVITQTIRMREYELEAESEVDAGCNYPKGKVVSDVTEEEEVVDYKEVE